MPFETILLLFTSTCLAAIVVGVLVSESKIPPKSAFQQKPAGGEEKSPTEQNGPDRPSADFAALINAIAAEGRAYRKEEQREDLGESWRGWVTVVLLGFTVIGVFWQVHEMIEVYGPISNQAAAANQSAEALISSERGKLFLGDTTLNKIGENDPSPKIDYSWINLGQGAVIINEILTNCELVGNEEIPPIPQFNNFRRSLGQQAITKNSSFGSLNGKPPLPPCILAKQITEHDWEYIVNKWESILFSGYIRYQDAFHRYRWNFGALYIGDVKFFSTNGIPDSYNTEVQED